jgi:hypothetical protein
MTAHPQKTDPLALARGLALVIGGGVLALAAARWGRAGAAAAAAGTLLSLANVWALARFAMRAMGQAAAGGPHTATAQLTAALGAKTALLLGAVWALTRSGRLQVLPFGLGLMVSVFALLGAGLWSAARAE